MARRRAPRSRVRLLFDLALLLALGAALLGPRLVRGWTAVLWTRHVAARSGPVPQPADARDAARWARRAVDLLAPLPPATEAAHLALDVGQRIAAANPAAARALYADLGRSLEAAAASRWRGLALGPARTRAAELLAATDPTPVPEPRP
jgi:hypothetical protein